MGKLNFYGLLIGGLLLLLTSCLGGDDAEYDDWNIANAQISSFSLSNDSLKGLSEVLFTIDQLNSKIFNKDSMPYGTILHEKVLVNVSTDSKYDVSNILFVHSLTNDSVWGTGDSIDFSAPVMITVYPHDGMSTKVYEAKVNIHQVNPDTMVWNKYSNLISKKTFKDMKVIPYHDSYLMYVFENDAPKLYSTDMDDMINWNEIPLTGFPVDAILSQITKVEDDLYVISEQGTLYYLSPEMNKDEGQEWSDLDNAPSIKALAGYLPHNEVTNRALILSAIVEEGDILRFATMNKNLEWTMGMETPETFPLSGFGVINFVSMYYPRLVIASGRDSKSNLSDKAWSTMDGLSWTLITNDKFVFSPREGAALTQYDNCLFIIGGIDASGIALSDIYHSKDYGVSWSDTLYVMPEEYTSRGYSSIIIDKNYYMLLFGGKASKSSYVLNELWRGRINRLGFGKE